MKLHPRLSFAARAAVWHFLVSIGVAALVASFVFGLWYPYPYRELAGGRALFLLVIGVDIVCGPLLTLVLFAPSKSRTELVRDLTLVVLIQVSALGYGLWSVWQARPLFLVAEVDRFKLIARPDLAHGALELLPPSLQPEALSGPQLAAIRDPRNMEEKNKVLLEAAMGGRDYGDRPEFYLPYAGANALKSLERARALEPFLQKFPDQRIEAQALADKAGLRPESLRYLPVMARQAWIALLDDKGMVVGFLKGDGWQVKTEAISN
jgi:hypothetical protein